jgi:hypothetical protein
LDWKKLWRKNQKKKEAGGSVRRGSQVPGWREFDYESTRFASDLIPGRFRLLRFLFFSPIWIFLTGGALYTVLVSPATTTLLTNANHVLLQTAHKNSHNLRTLLPPPPYRPRQAFIFQRKKKKV